MTMLLLHCREGYAAKDDSLLTGRLLQDRLLLNGGERRFPAEFASFKEALLKAEMAENANDATNTAQLLEMALTKGRIIEAKLNEPVKATPATPPQSTATGADPGALRADELGAQPPSANARPAASAPSGTIVTFPNRTSAPPSTDNTKKIAPSAPGSDGQADAAAASCQTIHPGPDALLGGEQTYVVQKRETIKLVAAKLGLNWRKLAKDNGLEQKKPAVLKPGQVIHYNNRKIVPKQLSEGLLINIPDRMLYFFKEGKLFKAAPIAVGIPRTAAKPVPAADGKMTVPSEKEQLKWQTPTGNFTILAKTKDPTWNVPPSIQEEMRQEGKKVLVKVPPGKNNPLGKYALKTSLAGIMLHSTNMPASIYGFSSHGCIRIYPEHMEELFKEINVKTRGEIIYKPVKLAVTDDSRVFLEVHGDVYNKTKDLRKEVQRLVKQYNVAELVDWDKINRLLKGKTGIAEEVTRSTGGIASVN